MASFGQRSRRPSQDHQSPVDPQNSSRPLPRRGSISGHEPRLLARNNSRDGRTGQRMDVDGGRRSRGRSNSVPPENRLERHDRPQDGPTGLTPASAEESLAWGQHWASTRWDPGRGQFQVQAQIQVTSQWFAHGGQLRDGEGHREGDHHGGRGRRSSDSTRPTPTPAPAPRLLPTSPSPVEPPVIPGITTTGGMGLRNLLRKDSRNRPKILFYNKNEPHYGFTNFSPHSVVYRGKRYPTSEHLFQSLKFVHKPNLMEHIRTCDPRPSVAFSEARRFAQEVQPNWKHESIKAMDTALFCKFTQHKDLKRELLATGDAELIENSDKDSFWGCGADGKGRNELGKALGRLRKCLREQGQ